ncbi:MAG: TetR/AcrR family transcriptional regulator [Candidatus Delongbacteria bacterium]
MSCVPAAKTEPPVRPSAAPAPPEHLSQPDPESPAGRIYLAARLCFAKQGFKGATTRGIAEAAGVNQALVHYYFGSKAALYRRVLGVEIRQILRHQTEGRLGVMPLNELLVGFPGRLVGWFRQHPEVANLLRSEIGAGGRGLQEIIQELGVHGPLGIRRQANAMQRAHTPAGALDLPVDHVLACILSLSYGMILIAPLLETVTRLDLSHDNQWKGLQASLEHLLRHGLIPKESA